MQFFLVETGCMADLLCSNEVIGLSITTGLFAAASLASCVYACCIRPFKNQLCPYCKDSLPPTAIREHLLTCAVHLEHWTAKVTRTSSRHMMPEFFYIDHPAKVDGHHLNRPRG